MGGSADYQRIFDQSFDDRLQRGIMRAAVVGWDSAYRLLKPRLDYWARHDALPHLRRGFVENNLRAFAKTRRLVSGSKGKVNFANNSFHTELIAGPTVLTVAYAESPDQLIREARFRATMARNPQSSWLDVRTVPAPDDPLVGVILYGPPTDKTKLRFPGFVCVRFPTHDWSAYVGHPINLMTKFSVAFTELTLRLRREHEDVLA